MSHITPPSENKPGQPLQPGEPKPERKWFNEQEIEKLKPIAKKFFKSQQDVPDDKINGMLKLVEGYIKKGEDLPPEYEKKTLILFFRLAKLGPERWNHVIAAIYKEGIDSLDPKKLGDLIKKEESGQPPQQTASTPIKRSHEEKAAVPSASRVISPTEPGFLEKKPRRIEEPGKRSEKSDQASGVVREGPEIKSQPQAVTASPLSMEALDEKFKEKFEKFFTAAYRLRGYTWDKLKRETQTLGSLDKCKEKTFAHGACWYYLNIKDRNKLNLLLQHLNAHKEVIPFSIMEAARALEGMSIEFPDFIMKLLAASITDPTIIHAIQSLYKKLNLGLDKQESVVKVVRLFKKFAVFEDSKWQEYFELTLNRIFSWLADEESFLFALWILECALKASSSPGFHAININIAFTKIEENQKEFYITYSKSSPLDKEIYKNAIEYQLLTSSLQEIKKLPEKAKKKFTPESVMNMISEKSIFEKHFCETSDERKAIEQAGKRLEKESDLAQGASVLMGKREEFIDGLVEALQANIVYVDQLEKFACGEEKAPKWPVQKPTSDLPFPHLVNMVYKFKNEKHGSVIHQQSLKMPPRVKKWKAIEFGLVFELAKGKLGIFHCVPKSDI